MEVKRLEQLATLMSETKCETVVQLENLARSLRTFAFSTGDDYTAKLSSIDASVNDLKGLQVENKAELARLLAVAGRHSPGADHDEAPARDLVFFPSGEDA